MSEELEFQRDRALYDRWKSVRGGAHPELDAMALAAYIEGRADGDTDRVEAAMAADPDLLGFVLATRAGLPAESASAELQQRAKLLVAGTVIPFRRRAAAAPVTGLRRVLAWSAVAASVAAVSLIGFNLGIEMEQTINAPSSGAAIDLLDQNMGGGLG